MKSLAELASQDRGMRAGEFTSYVKHLMLARGDHGMAAEMARSLRAPERVVDELRKAAVPAMHEGPLGGPKLLVSAFLEALTTESAFMAMLSGGMVRLPFETRIGAVATAVGAAVVQPGMAIPLAFSSLTQGPTLATRKAGALVVLSRELLQAGGAPAEALLSRSLRAGVAQAVDLEALAVLTSGAPTSAATANPEADLETARASVDPGSASRLFWIASSAVAAKIGGLTTTGIPRYPTATWTGGTLKGVPLLVTDQAGVGQLILVDASGVVGNADNVEIRSSDDAALQLDSAPFQSVGVSGSPQGQPVASSAVSLFQTDSRGVRCIMYFGIERARNEAVYVLSNVAWVSS